MPDDTRLPRCPRRRAWLLDSRSYFAPIGRSCAGTSRAGPATRIDLRGRLDWDALQDLPKNGVDVALQSPPLSNAQLRRVLPRLPDTVAATAVVELRRPLEIGDFYRLPPLVDPEDCGAANPAGAKPIERLVGLL